MRRWGPERRRLQPNPDMLKPEAGSAGFGALRLGEATCPERVGGVTSRPDVGVAPATAAGKSSRPSNSGTGGIAENTGRDVMEVFLAVCLSRAHGGKNPVAL